MRLNSGAQQLVRTPPVEDRLPAFGEIVRNSSITNRSSGVNATAVGLVRPILHRPLEPRPDVRVAVGRLQPRHHIVDHVAPLAERQEVVEALEDDVLPAEVLAQLAILQPVVDERPIGIR